MSPLSEQSTNIIQLNNDDEDRKRLALALVYKKGESVVGMCNNRSKSKKLRVPDQPSHATELTSQHLQRCDHYFVI